MITIHFGEPDYEKFKESLQRLRFNQRLCYYKGPPMLLDARERDHCLGKMAQLVWQLQELDYCFLYQVKVDGQTHYCLHPRSYSTPKSRKTYLNRTSIKEAELMISVLA